MDSAGLFWTATLDELKRGYLLVDNQYICLLCGKTFTNGEVFSCNGRFLEAWRAVEEHISFSHGNVFSYLIAMERKYTGLTGQQQQLMSDFFDGQDDSEIAKEMQISPSTVRNHRFRLKEKAKQAKVFLTIFELMEEEMREEDRLIDIHKHATMVDERYAITQAEREDKIRKFFAQDGKLTRFPRREKDKIIVLMEISKVFKSNLTYSEREVNELLKEYYEDYVLLRRYLIEYGFISRKADGSSYWAVF